MKINIKKLCKKLEVIKVDETDNKVLISVKSTIKECKCPRCGQFSNSVNSKYDKKYQDLPINGKTVYLTLENRVFECRNKECEETYFAETFDFAEQGQNKTNRLIERILEVSRTTSNRTAEKILREEGIVVGKSTIALLLSKYKSE